MDCLRPQLLTVVLLGMSMTTGCASIKSTQLFRSMEGKFSACSLPEATRGVPCKFKIETGVRAQIYETIFIDPAGGQTIVPERRIYSVQADPVYSDQNFMVHIPRPFAGTLDLTGTKGYHFNAEGYLTSIGASIEDKTIQDITTILGDASLGGLIKKQSANASGASGTLELQNRLIAVREFSYADPNWHVEFNGWVSQYQQCESQCPGSCQPTVIFQGAAVPVDLNQVADRLDYDQLK